jgi:glycosyltransferase involved in cell wall biosynthesis
MKHQNTACYFVATSWNDAPVSRHFKALSDALAARGHRVVMLVDGEKHEAEDHAGNPAVYTWPSRRPVKLRDARFLWRLIRERRPHCLIANFGASNVMMLVGWLLAVPCRADWYHTVSGAIDLDSKLDAKMARWKLNALRLRKRLVYGAATHIVPASEAARDDVGRVYKVPGGKCRVFYNSLADPLSDAADNDAASEGAGQGRGGRENNLVCVGRLFPTKGQDVLVRALALLKERAPDARVEFVGGGPDEAALRELSRSLGVERMCRFAGAVSHDEVLARVRAAAVTVVPSRSDNNPLVVIESLALGVPVVASAVGGIVESITDGVEGFLVPPEDPAALADRLARLLADSSLRQAMGRAARARYLAQFEQRKIIAEQAQWFESVVARA